MGSDHSGTTADKRNAPYSYTRSTIKLGDSGETSIPLLMVTLASPTKDLDGDTRISAHGSTYRTPP
jgi:hypothetical protein